MHAGAALSVDVLSLPVSMPLENAVALIRDRVVIGSLVVGRLLKKPGIDECVQIREQSTVVDLGFVVLLQVRLEFLLIRFAQTDDHV
jgi:hypothetical protein